MPFRAQGFFSSRNCAHLRVGQIGPRHALVHPILHDLSRGVVAEEKIDRGRHLEGAFVAMAHHRVDPLGIHHARAEHPRRLLGQRPHLG